MPKGKRKPMAGLRPPSLRGVVTVSEHYGKVLVKKWPRPRGKNRHATNVFWTQWLQGVTFLYKYQPAKFQAQMQDATRRTPWMARDPFISGARGRAFSFTDQTGRTYYPMPAREAVSQSLDAIAQVAGKMLIRGANSWEATDPPAAAATVTDWVSRGTSLDLGSAALKGGCINLAEEIILHGIGFYGTTAVNGTYIAAACKVDASNIITEIHLTPVRSLGASWPNGANQTLWLPFAAPVTLDAGSVWCIVAGRTDQGDTHQTPFMASNGSAGPLGPPWEGSFTNRRVYLPKAAPAVGDTVTRANSGMASIGVEFARP